MRNKLFVFTVFILAQMYLRNSDTVCGLTFPTFTVFYSSLILWFDVSHIYCFY